MLENGLHLVKFIFIFLIKNYYFFQATAMILIAALVNGYNSEDLEVRYLVEHIDWYITPVLNPDG
jgi:hypothetical protein